MDWKAKFTSRTWWVAVLAAAGSLYTAITGLDADQELTAAVATIATAVIGASYIIGEKWLDGKRVKVEEVKAGSETTVTTKTVTATATDRDTVKAVMGAEGAKAAQTAE